MMNEDPLDVASNVGAAVAGVTVIQSAGATVVAPWLVGLVGASAAPVVAPALVIGGVSVFLGAKFLKHLRKSD